MSHLRRQQLSKFKKFPIWRIDKPRNIQIIENGGWHFAYLLNPNDISQKIQSFAHGEFNIKDNTDIKKIEEKMLDMTHPTRGFKLKKVEIDNTFPKYIKDNRKKLEQWIV